jgi:ABC-type multidrug transport system fused ATPase/permease subunit
MAAWFTVLVPEVLTLAGMVVVVLAVDLTLGLAALAVAPPLAIVVALRRRRIRIVQRASRDPDAALAGEATEVLRNVRAVQAFTREREAGGTSPAAAAGPRWPPWTWRRAGRRLPTCCWRPGAGWCCGRG